MELGAFRKSLDGWLDEHQDELAPAYEGAGTLDQKMAQIAKVRRLLPPLRAADPRARAAPRGTRSLTRELGSEILISRQLPALLPL